QDPVTTAPGLLRGVGAGSGRRRPELLPAGALRHRAHQRYAPRRRTGASRTPALRGASEGRTSGRSAKAPRWRRTRRGPAIAGIRPERANSVMRCASSYGWAVSYRPFQNKSVSCGFSLRAMLLLRRLAGGLAGAGLRLVADDQNSGFSRYFCDRDGQIRTV